MRLASTVITVAVGPASYFDSVLTMAGPHFGGGCSIQ